MRSSLRQLVFDNLKYGLQVLIDSLPEFGLSLPDDLLPATEILRQMPDVLELFPQTCFESFTNLWNSPAVQSAAVLEVSQSKQSEV
jgi:hypothetical protein